MEQTKETAIAIKDDGFFARLKKFLKMVFGINGKYNFKVNSNEEKNDELKENQVNNIVKNNLNQIEQEKIEKNLEEILLELQEAYEVGIIKESDLTNEQIEDLKQLYRVQIELMKNKIDQNQEKILALKEKIDHMNKK